MPEIILVKSYEYYDYDESSIAVITAACRDHEWRSCTEEELLKLKDYVRIYNQQGRNRDYNIVLLEKPDPEAIEKEIFDSVYDFYMRSEKEAEERKKKQEEANRKRKETTLEKKKRQLEKLKKELGVLNE